MSLWSRSGGGVDNIAAVVDTEVGVLAEVVLVNEGVQFEPLTVGIGGRFAAYDRDKIVGIDHQLEGNALHTAAIVKGLRRAEESDDIAVGVLGEGQAAMVYPLAAGAEVHHVVHHLLPVGGVGNILDNNSEVSMASTARRVSSIAWRHP